MMQEKIYCGCSCSPNTCAKLGWTPGGGYGKKVPAWRMYWDYRNIHKCIDEEMMQEKIYCDRVVGKREEGKKFEFWDRMVVCAKEKTGAEDFKALLKQCRDDRSNMASIVAKMDKCKEEVLATMMELRKGIYEDEPASEAKEREAPEEAKEEEEEEEAEGEEEKE